MLELLCVLTWNSRWSIFSAPHQDQPFLLIFFINLFFNATLKLKTIYFSFGIVQNSLDKTGYLFRMRGKNCYFQSLKCLGTKESADNLCLIPSEAEIGMFIFTLEGRSKGLAPPRLTPWMSSVVLHYHEHNVFLHAPLGLGRGPTPSQS